MDSLAGIAVLAVVGLWLAYLVPHRLRQRQQMLESRVNDRFSGNLRVLAVATGDAPASAGATRKVGRGSVAVALHSHGDCTTTSSVNAPLLTPPHGMTVRPRRHHPEGERDMEHTSSPTVAAAPARAGLHARRAAAARRRALLTVTLLVLTAATGALTSATTVSAWFVLAPAVLLVAVLALGRRAVQANARADAAWLAREHARRADAASGDVRLAGRPAPAVRPRVTGRAVKSSQSQTQMIARVRPADAAGSADAADSAGGAPSAEVTRPADTATASEPTSSAAAATDGAPAGTGAASVATARTSRDTSTDRSTSAGSTAAATADATEWTSVPVPRPVYTMKSAAPRWEPAPLTAEMAQITQARRAELAAGDAPVAEPADGASSVLREAEAPSDSLGVNLNSVLARRRAAGE